MFEHLNQVPDLIDPRQPAGAQADVFLVHVQAVRRPAFVEIER